METKVDGWKNFLVGIGSKLDKRTGTVYGHSPLIPDKDLEAIYLSDGLGTRIIDVVADDMTREWIDLAPENSTGIKEAESRAEAVEKVLEELDAETVCNTALKWKRLYGGAIIIVGALDGNSLDAPLNVKGIREIDYLRVIDRSDILLQMSEFQTDPTKKDFGKPIRFHVRFEVGNHYQEAKVHASRCLQFKGIPVPRNAVLGATFDHRYWGLSALQPVFEALSDYGTVSDAVTNILYEFIIGKYQLNGLSDLIASGKEDLIQQRMEIMSAMKSVIHAILLDEGETYSRDTATLSGIPEIIDRYMMRLCSVTGIPMTRLFGRSPGGLNATGESDTMNYYDMIRSKQKTELKPALHPLLKIIQEWKKEKLLIRINFEPLQQTSEKENAEIKKIEAETNEIKARMYQSYIDSGVLTAETVYDEEWSEKFGEWSEPTNEDPMSEVDFEAPAPDETIPGEE